MPGKLTKDQQIFFFAVAGFLFFIFVYFKYFLNPTLISIEQSEKKYMELVEQVKSAEQQSKRLPELQQKKEKLQIELMALEKQLPTDRDFPGILRIITREALQENLNFVSLQPLEPKRDNYFDVLEFDMSMTGTLQSFIRFVSSLGQQERIFQIEKVKLSGGSSDISGIQNLNITFSLKTYAYSG